MQLLGHREKKIYIDKKKNRNRTRMEKNVFNLCYIFGIDIAKNIRLEKIKIPKPKVEVNLSQDWDFFGKNMDNISLLYGLFTPKMCVLVKTKVGSICILKTKNY